MQDGNDQMTHFPIKKSKSTHLYLSQYWNPIANVSLEFQLEKFQTPILAVDFFFQIVALAKS